MKEFNRKAHWEHIYLTKRLNEVSWYQPKPETSLRFIAGLDLPLNATIIDVGGGDSFLVDNLLDLGFTNISVLDISSKAIHRAQKRLGKKAESVTWIEADAANFIPDKAYDLWHDRAAFHFLTDPTEIDHYVAGAKKGVKENGHIILGTFAVNGPKKCSGIEVVQYSKQSLPRAFEPEFKLKECQKIAHLTPFETLQEFVFAVMRRL